MIVDHYIYRDGARHMSPHNFWSESLEIAYFKKIQAYE